MEKILPLCPRWYPYLSDTLPHQTDVWRIKTEIHITCLFHPSSHNPSRLGKRDFPYSSSSSSHQNVPCLRWSDPACQRKLFPCLKRNKHWNTNPNTGLVCKMKYRCKTLWKNLTSVSSWVHGCWGELEWRKTPKVKKGIAEKTWAVRIV